EKGKEGRGTPPCGQAESCLYEPAARVPPANPYRSHPPAQQHGRKILGDRFDLTRPATLSRVGQPLSPFGPDFPPGFVELMTKNEAVGWARSLKTGETVDLEQLRKAVRALYEGERLGPESSASLWVRLWQHPALQPATPPGADT